MHTYIQRYICKCLSIFICAFWWCLPLQCCLKGALTVCGLLRVATKLQLVLCKCICVLQLAFPHTQTYILMHTYSQISLFRLVALIWGILLSLDIMLFCSTFGCGSKATFAFISMRRRSHIHTYVSKYVHVCNEHTYIYVCRSVWHSIDWHQNNRV